MRTFKVFEQPILQPPATWALSDKWFLMCGFAALILLSGLVLPTAHASSVPRNKAHSGGNTDGLYASSPKDVPPHAPGYLGILFGNLSDEDAMSLHLKAGRGVEIVMVDHDGPAGKAGLRPHDVILSMNGQAVTSADDLRRMIHDAGVGADVSLLVVRDKKQITVKTQLAYRGEVEREAAARMTMPAPPEGADPSYEPSAPEDGSDPAIVGGVGRGPGFLSQMLHSTPFTGLMVEAMEPQLAGFFGAPAGQGLLVETVIQGSPADMAGLKAGDVILRVDSIGVSTTSEWIRRLHAGKGRPIVLVVLRERRQRTVTLTPALKHKSELEWMIEFEPEPSFA